jgi:tetratricopeptide (TPR) repeat protein
MADFTDRLAAALAPTYRIERELGGGGMSRVFLAEEPALGRKVVIKVLPPEMGAGVNQERFRREVQLAATLQHPNIVPLLTAGSAGDLLYYVMPYVEGESLRTRLARDGELPVTEAARLLREVADALAYAHDRGIVHRDIKPGNVMISSGHALVTDFGIAKAVTASSGGPSVTSLGLALGTPAYMSPEQASGDPTVDHRADLYALGAMAYEMLAGQTPFVATNPQSLLAAHVTRTPERLGSLRPAVPAALETAVMRCLEKRPADRWQQARDLLPEFEAASTPGGGITPTGASSFSSGAAAALARRHPIRVAVLFGLAALVVLSMTWWLEQRFGLPDWVLLGAGVLLLVGLPIVLMAARHEREHLRNTAERAIPVPSGPAGRLKTLRGAIAGGGLAFLGLAAGTGAFMALRTAGVGPFATLLSAGVLKQGTRLVLADFANSTPDSTLAASITEAFRIDLSQSRSVRLLDGRQVGVALQRMERATDSGLAAPVALELALREGAAAVVAGEIAPLASGYVLSVRLLSAGDGGTLLADREIADDAAGIIPAVEALSKRLRERIGESLRTIRSGEPLAQVTTASLEALRLYSLADRAANAGKVTEAVRLYEQAIGVDSTFGMAWRRLAVVLGNSGRDPVRRAAAAQRAYELRDRLPPREGLLAEAYYYQAIRKQDEATDAYRRLLAAWSDDAAAQNNLAILLMEQQQFAEAEALLRGLADSGSTVTSTYQNLVEVRLRTGNIAGAESAVAVFRQRVPEAGVPARNMRREIAMIQGQFPEALAVVQEGQVEPDAEARARAQAMAVPLLRLLGRWQEAGQEGSQAVRGLAAVDADQARRLAVQQELDQAIAEAYLLGRTEEGRARVDALLRRQPLDSIRAERRPYLTLVWAEAILGRPARAREYFQALRGMATPAEEDDLKAGEGMVAFAEARWAEAIPLLRASATASGWFCRNCGLVQIGEAFDRLGLTDSARVAYETYATDLATGNIGQDSDLPVSYIRLGEIYEAKGDRQRAIEYYTKLLDLWQDADPVLQPRIKDIRERVGKLAGEGRE